MQKPEAASEQTEEKNGKPHNGTGEVRAAQGPPAVVPGRPASFEEALATSMAKFDAALHRLGK